MSSLLTNSLNELALKRLDPEKYFDTYLKNGVRFDGREFHKRRKLGFLKIYYLSISLVVNFSLN